MADGAVLIGVTAVLTSGVLGPLVLHHTQKDRDSLSDQRTALDAAIQPLAECRAQGAWLQAWAFETRTDQAEVEKRAEELLDLTHLVEAHGVKLQIRFGDCKLVTSYLAAGGALNEQASIFWRRRAGVIPTVAQYDEEMRSAETIYRDAYARFIELASSWHAERNWPHGPFLSQ
jgi:hypothetical protein